ncbi:MAG: aminoacyl-tRNA hydrolase [Bauldia sp.]
MFLLVGLGNPGPEYENNRHNIGFMALDAIQRHGFSPWRKGFAGLTAEGTLGSVKTLLLKPLTYMNESGRSVAEASRFHKVEPADILVIHDEIDLPAGKLRMKVGGGSGGHNGVRSVTAHIGDSFRRMRLGVGHPGHKDAVHNHVLRDFAKADREWVSELLEAITANAPLLAEGKDSTFANKVHLATNPGGDDPPPRDPPPPRPTPPTRPPSPESGGPLAGALRRLFGKQS